MNARLNDIKIYQQLNWKWKTTSDTYVAYKEIKNNEQGQATSQFIFYSIQFISGFATLFSTNKQYKSAEQS